MKYDIMIHEKNMFVPHICGQGKNEGVICIILSFAMMKKLGLFFSHPLRSMSLEDMNLGAVNYLLKPLKYERLEMELDRFFSTYSGKKSASLLLIIITRCIAYHTMIYVISK